MPSQAELLQQAIQAARAGQKSEARDLLLELVDIDPHNEMAWMWLSGLVDSLEDRIIACENVLTINPGNEKVRTYLASLQRQYEPTLLAKKNDEALSLFAQAKACAEQKDRNQALQLARQAVEKRADYEDAWLLIARLSPAVDQRIAALEKALQLNPSNPKTASALERARHLRDDPMSAARRLEQLGKYTEAIQAYESLARRTKDTQNFDYIYKQITRIEGLRKENIRHVAPTTSIARLTFGWPLLYFSLALIQMGLNPFRHLSLLLLLGLPIVTVGSFLLSLAEIRSTNIVWQRVFNEHGDGSSFARLVASTAGWFLVIVPHVLLLFDSLKRLQSFKIPPMPL
jgi:tetratricopeptide (TPR) repeat protein